MRAISEGPRDIETQNRLNGEHLRISHIKFYFADRTVKDNDAARRDEKKRETIAFQITSLKQKSRAKYNTSTNQRDYKFRHRRITGRGERMLLYTVK